ncbi:hypothetical protein S245_036927 [Arachis hypogaea]
MCFQPSFGGNSEDDYQLDFYRLMFISMAPASARQVRVPIPGPFYRAFANQLGDFVIFKDNHENEFRVMLDKSGAFAHFAEGFQSMVRYYNIRHGAWMRAYYKGDNVIAILIWNLDGSWIVYPRSNQLIMFFSPFVDRKSPGRVRGPATNNAIFDEGDFVPYYRFSYTPPLSPRMTQSTPLPPPSSFFIVVVNTLMLKEL